MANKNPAKPNSSLAVILIVAGLIILLAKTNLLNINPWLSLQYLPMIAIALGLFLLLGKKRGGAAAVLILAAGGLFLYFQPSNVFGQSGKVKIQHIQHELESVKKAKVTILPAVANLDLKSLSDGNSFVVGDIELLKNQSLVDQYMAQGDKANYTLHVETPNHRVSFGCSKSLKWAVFLASGVELDLKVHTGVGNSKLDLSKLNISKLDIESGVGEAEIRFPNSGGFKANIESGVGDIELQIPRNLPIKISIDSGIGNVNIGSSFEERGRSYYSPNYEDSTRRVELKIDSGVGSVTIKRF